MVEIQFLLIYISSPKTQSVDLFCFSILMFTSVQSVLIAMFSDLDLFLSKVQIQYSTGKLRFSFYQVFHKY